jgi:hypothetical protein
VRSDAWPGRSWSPDQITDGDGGSVPKVTDHDAGTWFRILTGLRYEADTQAKVDEACRHLGFRRAKRPRGFRLSGRELLNSAEARALTFASAVLGFRVESPDFV